MIEKKRLRLRRSRENEEEEADRDYLWTDSLILMQHGRRGKGQSEKGDNVLDLSD